MDLLFLSDVVVRRPEDAYRVRLAGDVRVPVVRPDDDVVRPRVLSEVLGLDEATVARLFDIGAAGE